MAVGNNHVSRFALQGDKQQLPQHSIYYVPRNHAILTTRVGFPYLRCIVSAALLALSFVMKCLFQRCPIISIANNCGFFSVSFQCRSPCCRNWVCCRTRFQLNPFAITDNHQYAHPHLTSVSCSLCQLQLDSSSFGSQSDIPCLPSKQL